MYYGDGNCSIEGSNSIVGVQIYYTGAVRVIDKTPDSFEIFVGDNTILIFSLNPKEVLNELFEYKGSFKIKSILVAGNAGERLNAAVKRNMDYAELIRSNAEDMTINSEDLNVTHKVGYVKKSSFNTPTINNLNTDTDNIELYLQSGKRYNGAFHVYKKGLRTMTGSHPDQDSKLLYNKIDDKLKPVSIKTIPVRKPRKKSAVKIQKINRDGARINPRFPNKHRHSRKVRIREDKTGSNYY